MTLNEIRIASELTNNRVARIEDQVAQVESAADRIRSLEASVAAVMLVPPSTSSVTDVDDALGSNAVFRSVYDNIVDHTDRIQRLRNEVAALKVAANNSAGTGVNTEIASLKSTVTRLDSSLHALLHPPLAPLPAPAAPPTALFTGQAAAPVSNAPPYGGLAPQAPSLPQLAPAPNQYRQEPRGLKRNFDMFQQQRAFPVEVHYGEVNSTDATASAREAVNAVQHVQWPMDTLPPTFFVDNHPGMVSLRFRTRALAEAFVQGVMTVEHRMFHGKKAYVVG